MNEAREQEDDSLVKPDMEAVLSRTHLSKTPGAFLLPIFEAISNGIHGVESRFAETDRHLARIHVHISNTNDPNRFTVSIEDNGIGLNDENYKSFKTPFSGHKLKRNGRGFGRFIAFKVFSAVRYETRYDFLGQQSTRAFRFDVKSAKEILFENQDVDLLETGLKVTYKNPITTWGELVRELKSDDVADEIGSHFLPQFLYGWLPDISIQFDDGEPENITSHFKAVFVQSDAGEINVEIDGESEKLEYSLAKIPKTRSFKNHCLLLSAADRIVGAPRDLTNKLGQPHFYDEENERYIVIAVVKSSAFETRLNDSRTGINLAPKVVENIVSAISDVIQGSEKDQIEKIKSDQAIVLDGALRENPILRLGLRGKNLSEYVTSKPNNWNAEEFISDLAIERYRASSDLTKSIATVTEDADSYTNRIKEIVSKIDENKREALAEYVIHRKNVIELVEAARRFDEQGKHPPEDVIHDLIFKRFSDSTETKFFEHNLWIVDDLLSFLPYVSSDRTIHGGRRSKGDKVADLAFFDESLVLGDHDGTTINIVEFKKPSRNDYRFGNEKTDPVLQVINTLNKATDKGGIHKKDGTHFTFNGVVRRFAYIIADHTSTLVDVLKTHDFKNEWNPKIFFRYRDNEELYIQAFGYDTLIENAKKRNQAFFAVLLDE